MAGKLLFEFDFPLSSPAARKPSRQQRILLLGDFSGQNPDKQGLSGRVPVTVDVDNCESLPARFGARLLLELEGIGEIPISLSRMEDFHPDALCQSLGVFRALRDQRGRLANPATYAAAAEELLLGTAPATRNAPAAPVETGGDGNLFERLLGAPVVPVESVPRSEELVQKLLRHWVGPHLHSGVDLEQQRQLLAAVDDAMTQIMRQILHHPQFQALEAAWKGVEWLVDRIDEGEAVSLNVLDVSLDELWQDWRQAEGRLEATALNRILTESSLAYPGGAAWDWVAGLYGLGETVESLDLLEFLAALAARCGGVFLAEASPKLLGCDALATVSDASDWEAPPEKLTQAWQTLRRSPLAPYAGLALPRFMLRRPYGKKSDPLEGFAFEEMPTRPPHEAYLWGNPALACVLLAVRHWIEGDEEPESLRDLGSLPSHIYDDGSGQAVKPCAEVWLNERTALRIMDAGIMPVLSLRNQDHGLIPRLQSIAEPATALC